MISPDEASALKFFFLGLAEHDIKTINLHPKVSDCMQDLAVFEIVYDRISITSDVVFELIDYFSRSLFYDPINLKDPLILTRHVCLALDLFPIFWKTELSILKHRSHYLLKEGNLEYYFELVANLDETVKEHFSPIDISKYIMVGKK